jgi:hypothetical protein
MPACCSRRFASAPPRLNVTRTIRRAITDLSTKVSVVDRLAESHGSFMAKTHDRNGSNAPAGIEDHWRLCQESWSDFGAMGGDARKLRDADAAL